MPHTGTCLCGGCKIYVASTHETQGVCHCKDCQHVSSSAFITSIIPRQSDVRIEGDVREYKSKADNGNEVSRLFCGMCGTPIAQKSPIFKAGIAIQTGNLPDFKDIPITEEIYIENRWDGAGIKPIKGAKQQRGMRLTPGNVPT